MKRKTKSSKVRRERQHAVAVLRTAALLGGGLLLAAATTATRSAAASGGGGNNRPGQAAGAAARQNVVTTENVSSTEIEGGNLVADAMRTATGADIAMIAAAAFKPNATAPRPASAEQIAALLDPPTDEIVVLTLRGAQILAALERSVSFAPQKSSGFLQVSGIKFSFNTARSGGMRVSTVTVNNQPLDAAKNYRVATTRPLAQGQQGYFQIWDRDQVTTETKKSLADALAELSRVRGGMLQGQTEGRIVARRTEPQP